MRPVGMKVGLVPHREDCPRYEPLPTHPHLRVGWFVRLREWWAVGRRSVWKRAISDFTEAHADGGE